MQMDAYMRRDYTFQDRTRDVFVRGDGPAVIILHELPGMVPECIALGDRISAAGYTVYLPLFFGKPGQSNSNLRNALYALRFCISREWAALRMHRTSPVADWVRALARQAHQECGGPGVGAIGMCMTGGFAIPLMLEECLLAPVICQPALPFGIGAARKADLGVSSEDLAAAKARSEQGVDVLGYRFSEDRVSPPQKFDSLCREFADRFEANVIPSEPGNLHNIDSKAHSILTLDYCDEEGHPTRLAFERILEFLNQRLQS